MRELLKLERDIMPSDARAVSQTVFNYFRWHGWLDLDAPLNLQIRKARELAENFVASPETFSDESLVERVVPKWLQEEMEITPTWARAIQAEPKTLACVRKPGQGRALCEKLGAAKLERNIVARCDPLQGRGEICFNARISRGRI